MDAISFSCEWPMIVTRVTSVPSSEEFNAYLEAMTRDVIMAKRHHVQLIVMDGGSYARAERKTHVAWQRRHQAKINKYCAATALVMPEVSVFMRFALSALLSVMGDAASPTRLFSSEQEASAWLERMLQRAAA